MTLLSFEMILRQAPSLHNSYTLYSHYYGVFICFSLHFIRD